MSTFRNSVFDQITSASFELLATDGSVAISGTFDVKINWCNITYVTTTAKYDKLLVHVHNGYTTTRTIHQVSCHVVCHYASPSLVPRPFWEGLEQGYANPGLYKKATDLITQVYLNNALLGLNDV